MGFPGIPFFYDLSKTELEKELEKVKAQRSVATEKAEIMRLDRDIADLEEALASK